MKKNERIIPFFLSLLVHGFVVALCFWVFLNQGGKSIGQRSTEKVDIIEAVVIDGQQLDNQYAEIEQRRLAAIAEAKRLAAEKEAQRLAAIAEAERLAAEQEAKRLAAEQEAKRLAAEQEAKRLAAEQEAKRLAAEQEAQRLAAEQETQRLAAEQERQRQLQEELAQIEAETLARIREEEANRILQERERIANLEQEQQRRTRQRHISSESDRYTGMMRHKIERNWVTIDQGDSRTVKLRVRMAPGGVVIDVQVEETSGLAAFDDAAVRAIYKSSPLPVSDEEDVFEAMREIVFNFTPTEIVKLN